MTASATASAGSDGLSTRQKLLLALILTGQFMAVLDASIVNVAIPTIRRDLGATGAQLQLIVASYVIAYAVLLITGARLGQRYGFRRTFLWGLAIFTVASLACGLAPTSEVLIVVRAIQGGGAALMVPQVFSLIQRNFSGPGRAQALSLWAATLALGGLVGQVLGGLLVTANILGQVGGRSSWSTSRSGSSCSSHRCACCRWIARIGRGRWTLPGSCRWPRPSSCWLCLSSWVTRKAGRPGRSPRSWPASWRSRPSA